MTDVFGDAEPEDAWDRDDTVAVLLVNLLRRLALLDLAADALRLVGGRVELLDEIDQRAHWFAQRRDALDDRGQLRLDDLLDDIIFVRARIEAEP
jgi:hypothetical protein